MKKSARMVAFLLAVLFAVTSVSPSVKYVDAAKKSMKVTFTKPSDSTLIIKKGKAFQLKTNLKNNKVVYSSNKPNVVSVDKKGRVTAKKSKGSAVITVRSNQNKKKTARLKVRIGTPVTSITTSCDSAKLYVGNTLNLSKTLSVKPNKATIKKVRWSSSKPKVAFVKNAVITAKSTGKAKIYANATDGSGKKAVCNVTVSKRNTNWKTTTALKDVYKDNFSVGVAIPASTLITDTDESRLTSYHFNSVTAENDMKPDSLLDWQNSEKNLENGIADPAIKFTNMDKMLDYAKKNGLKVRFHTLVWHSQTPDWFFYEDYDDSKSLVSSEVMKKRLESYINQIVEHVETKYPGVVYAWDVVNEAMESNQDRADTKHFNIRTKHMVNGQTQDNLWYKTLGWEYVKYSFQYTKNAMNKYGGTGKLFYNDFMERTMYKEIIAMINDVNANGKLCDGMGCQAHLRPAVDYKDYWKALQAYQAAGLEIQITELDIGIRNSEEEAITNEMYDVQAGLYKTYFDMFRSLPAITNVTVWGVSDATSWRGSVYPLLFDGNLSPKKAFFGAIQDPGVTLLEYR